MEQKSNTCLARSWRRWRATLWQVLQPETHLLSECMVLTRPSVSLRNGETKGKWDGRKGGQNGRKDETWRNSKKEMKRTLLFGFFSCLTQLSDFAFKFKTVDQTARGTLYFCQETIWYLSVALLHARNTEPCLSAALGMAQCAKNSKIHKCLCWGVEGGWVGGGSDVQDLQQFIS